MWFDPGLAPAIIIYLAEFMVIDCFLSLAFLAWPVRSPNYFFVIDRKIWLWNWSKPAKAVNSSLCGVVAGHRLDLVGGGDRLGTDGSQDRLVDPDGRPWHPDPGSHRRGNDAEFLTRLRA